MKIVCEFHFWANTRKKELRTVLYATSIRQECKNILVQLVKTISGLERRISNNELSRPTNYAFEINALFCCNILITNGFIRDV